MFQAMERALFWREACALAIRLHKHDPLLVDEDVQLFLDVFPSLTGPCQRCQPWADRVTDGCCWALDESAGAAHVPRRLQPMLSFRAGGCVWPPSSLASRHTRGAC